MPSKQCKDCDPGSKRPTPYPGPRCATHHREKKKADRQRNRDRRVQQVYSLPPDAYAKIYEEQNGLCAICGPVTGRNGRSRRLAVDHDHTCCNGPQSCGKCVRGLLCKTCNTIVGHFRDNPGCFKRGFDYLKNPPARKVLDL